MKNNVDLNSLKKEMEIIKKISSPYIVNYITDYSYNNKNGVILEYIEGKSLDLYIKEQSLTADDKICIMRDILRGLN